MGKKCDQGKVGCPKCGGTGWLHGAQREQEFLAQWNRRALDRQGSGKWMPLEQVKALLRKERIWDASRGQSRKTWAAEEICDELDALAQAQDAQTGEGK